MVAKIGLRSSGLVVFSGRMVSVLTGLIFTVMVARWLAPEQFGLWEVITDFVTFASYPIGLILFWATRDVARGRPVGRTALVLGIAMSALGLLLYFVFTFVSYSRAANSLLPFVLGSALVPLTYLNQISNSIVQGSRPSAFGYSLVLSEVTKLAVAYPALFIYKIGIEGVIVALMAAYLVQSATSFYLVRGALKGPLDLAQGRRWLRVGWLPAISYLPSVVGVSDTFVAFLGFNAAIVGYYQAAFLVAAIVGYSGALAYSLYPLLLSGGSEKLTAITIEFSLLFSIPMAVGASVLAGPILFLLGTKYLPATNGLIILALAFVFITISGILDQTLLGRETVDAGSGSTFGMYARSNLLFVPLVNLSSGVLYIVGMFVSLSYAFANNLSISDTIVLWTASQLVVAALTMVVKAARARPLAGLLPGVSILYYLVAAAAMGVVVYFVSGFFLDRALDTVFYGLRLMIVVAVGAAVYLGIVSALDAGFRSTVYGVLKTLSRVGSSVRVRPVAGAKQA